MADEYAFGIILDSARRGNTAEVTQITDMCIDRAYFIVAMLAENETDAIPLMEKVFKTAFLNLDVISQQTGLQNWVDTLAMRHSIEYLTDRYADLYAPFSDIEDAPPISIADLETERYAGSSEAFAQYISSDIDSRLKQQFSSIPPDMRIIAMLFYLQNLTISEIAGDLRTKRKLAHARTAALRDTLRTDLDFAPAELRIPLFSWLLKQRQGAAKAPDSVRNAAIAAAVSAAKEYAAIDRTPKKKCGFFSLFRK